MTTVLDTSTVLAFGKKAFTSFEGEEVVVPLAVVQELESKRNDPVLGLTARSALRFIEELRGRGDIMSGVAVNDLTTVRLELNHVDTSGLPDVVRTRGGNDVRILAVAKSLDATLISQDLPLRIMAEVCGVAARELTSRDLPKDDESVYEILIPDEEMDEFYRSGSIKVDDDLPMNSNVVLSSYSGGSALGVAGSEWSVRRVEDVSVNGITGKNSRQRFALDHLMNDDVRIVSLGGRSGSGKSILAIASAVQQVRSGKYSKAIIHKPAVDSRLGGVEGALPGTLADKYDGHTLSVFDALEGYVHRSELERMVNNGSLELAPTNFIRGRTYHNAICILDESQNAEFNLIATFISRMGVNSKAILTHDLSQIDSLYATKHGGIHAAVSKLTGNRLFAHVEFDKSLRSETAELGASLLDDYLF